MSKVVIFGTGQGAKTAFRYLKADSDHDVCGFAVDKKYRDKKTFMELPVVDFEAVEESFPPAEYNLFILMSYEGMNRVRMEKFLEGKAKGYDFISYVSSDIHALEQPVVGENCFIMEGQTINPEVSIGDNVVMWSGNHIGDNTIIESHVWFSSHVCIGGDCTIEERSFLGNNCTISNNVKVGRKCFIGPNSLISGHVEEDGVYVVQPAERSGLDSERFMGLVHMHCEAR